MQTEPIATMQSMDALHIVVTLSLFLVNVMFTHLISQRSLPARLCHVGHEMVYMSAAIVVSHLFTVSTGARLVPVVALFPYLVLWALTLVLTRRALELGDVRLHPLTGVTLILGGVALFGALSGRVEAALQQCLPYGRTGLP